MTRQNGPPVQRLRRILADRRACVWAPALAAVLVLAALATVPTWNDPGDSLDEGLLLLEPELLHEGVLPYEDYESFYGPANTHVLAGVYLITGPEVDAERAVGLVYRLALVAAVFALAASTGPLTALAAGVIAGAFSVGPAALAWFAGVALGLWALFGLQRSSRGAGTPIPWWAGVAAGLAVSYRPQFGLAVALAAVPLLAGRPLSASRGFAGWVVVGLVPLLVHIVLAGPVQVFESLILDALFRSGPQSSLPLPPRSSPEAKLLVLVIGANVAMLAAAVLAWVREPGSREARRLASLALFSLGLLPQALGRIESLHILNVACVSVALVPTVLASPLLLRRLEEGPRRVAAVGATGLAVLVLAQTWLNGVEVNYRRALGGAIDPVTASYDRRENWVTRGSREFPFFNVEQAAQINNLIAAVEQNSEPGDRVIFAPQDLQRTFYNQTALYHLFPELEPGTYHLTMAPGTANREGSRLPGDIAEADVVVLGTGIDWRLVAPNSELESGDATEELTSRFCLRQTSYPYQVFTPCERDPSPE